MKTNTNLDMSNNELVNAKFEEVSDFPTDNLFEGRLVYHSTNKKYYYYNGTKWIETSVPTSTGYGYLGYNETGKLTVLDTVSQYNTLQTIEAAKGRNLIPKIGANGKVTEYPYIVDNEYTGLSKSSDWQDAVPTSGCVIDSVRKMPAKILNNRLSNTVNKLIGVNSSNQELYLFDPAQDSIVSSDERIITASKYNDINTSRKIVDSLSKTDFDNFFDGVVESEVPDFNKSIPTVKAVNDALSNNSPYTYIVNNNTTLINWLTGVSGNNYSSVLIKPGQYTINSSDFANIKYLNSSAVGTHSITGANGVIYINIEDSNNLGLSSGLFRMNSGIAYKNYDFKMENCHFTINAINNSTTSYPIYTILKKIKNISNCVFDATLTNTPYCLYFLDDCESIDSCYTKLILYKSGIAEYFMFNNCRNLNNIKAEYTHNYSGYNRTVEGTGYNILFNSCTNISNVFFEEVEYQLDINVKATAHSNLFSGCKNISNVFFNKMSLNLANTAAYSSNNTYAIISLFTNCDIISNVNFDGDSCQIQFVDDLSNNTNYINIFEDCSYLSNIVISMSTSDLNDRNDLVHAIYKSHHIANCYTSGKAFKIDKSYNIVNCHAGFGTQAYADGPHDNNQTDISTCESPVDNTPAGGFNLPITAY